MKERPILMNAHSIGAILDGRKTQTRRVLKPEPEMFCTSFDHLDSLGQAVYSDGTVVRCRYGISGDHLWVRETWATITKYDDLKPSAIPRGDARWPLVYYASHPESAAWNSPNRGRVRPSIFMPRWASRITLEVTDVRVERVQEIKHADILAEGVQEMNISPEMTLAEYKAAGGPMHQWNADDGRHTIYGTKAKFSELWESINAKRGYGWDVNPYVWVVEFKRVES